jgi:hypothetical protein
MATQPDKELATLGRTLARLKGKLSSFLSKDQELLKPKEKRYWNYAV